MDIKRNRMLEDGIYRHIATSQSRERPGWHLSDFLYCNAKTFYRKIGSAPAASDQQSMMYWAGHAAQFFLAPVKPEDAKSFELDGIALTPDFLDAEFSGYKIGLAEMKSTRKSAKNFNPREQKAYLMQMMGYCKVTGLKEANLIMYFIHGDYSGRPPMPTIQCWSIAFKPEEIDANWAEVTRRRDILDEAVKANRFPDPLIMGFQAECDMCECQKFCPKSKANKER